MLGKATKIACVTCVAAAAIAIVTSGAAINAAAAGGKYLVKSVKHIVKSSDANHTVTDDTVITDAVSSENAL